jgi:hypothetical protein
MLIFIKCELFEEQIDIKMSDNENVFKMICFINNYESWDDTIHEHACKFSENYSIYPNLMLASKVTWDKIDEYANLFNPENIKPTDEFDEDFDLDEELKSISNFATSDYILEFCIDLKVKEGYFILVFDEEPIFDGEPVEDSENINVEVYRRIA